MIAGPSEILVIADADNDPDWIALDLLSQAEHDESAQSILLTPDSAFAARVASAVEKRLETLERRAIAGVSWPWSCTPRSPASSTVWDTKCGS